MIKDIHKEFPASFKWGIATSAYQIEGAWDKDGKSMSIWDDYVRKEGAISDGSTGDIACDHYNRWKEDIDLLCDLGVSSYRLSIAWCRIIPDGIGMVNEKGLAFYDGIINYCLEKNIEPMITLYHWDLPLTLEEKGGVTNDEFVSWFCNYCSVVIKHFSDRVKKYITINQPFSVYRAYTEQHRAPALGDPLRGLIAISNLLYAHGLVAKMVKEQYADIEIGITLNLVYVEAFSDSDSDLHAAKMREVLTNDSFVWPLLKGYFPEALIEHAKNLGVDTGYFLDSERLSIMNTPIDFIGINYYQRGLTVSNENIAVPFKQASLCSSEYHSTDGRREVYPKGLEIELKKLFALAPSLPVYITENGADYRNCGLDDSLRINYIRDHLLILKKMCDEGFPVNGYYLWTLMDNFEWEYGYEAQYGIFAVDKNLTRTPKKSALWYKNVIQSNGASLVEGE